MDPQKRCLMVSTYTFFAVCFMLQYEALRWGNYFKNFWVEVIGIRVVFTAVWRSTVLLFIAPTITERFERRIDLLQKLRRLWGNDGHRWNEKLKRARNNRWAMKATLTRLFVSFVDRFATIPNISIRTFQMRVSTLRRIPGVSKGKWRNEDVGFADEDLRIKRTRLNCSGLSEDMCE